MGSDGDIPVAQKFSIYNIRNKGGVGSLIFIGVHFKEALACKCDHAGQENCDCYSLHIPFLANFNHSSTFILSLGGRHCNSAEPDTVKVFFIPMRVGHWLL